MDGFCILLAWLRVGALQCNPGDIGSYQQAIDIITTMSVITNAFIIGFTSHSLYLCFPEMDGVERVWASVILEHLLFLWTAVQEQMPAIMVALPTIMRPDSKLATHDVQQRIRQGLAQGYGQAV